MCCANEGSIAAIVFLAYLEGMTKDASTPKPQAEDADETEQTMGDIVAPFERTRAKRLDTGEDEPVETPNEAAIM